MYVKGYGEVVRSYSGVSNVTSAEYIIHFNTHLSPSHFFISLSLCHLSIFIILFFHFILLFFIFLVGEGEGGGGDARKPLPLLATQNPTIGKLVTDRDNAKVSGLRC